MVDLRDTAFIDSTTLSVLPRRDACSAEQSSPRLRALLPDQTTRQVHQILELTRSRPDLRDLREARRLRSPRFGRPRRRPSRPSCLDRAVRPAAYLPRRWTTTRFGVALPSSSAPSRSSSSAPGRSSRSPRALAPALIGSAPGARRLQRPDARRRRAGERPRDRRDGLCSRAHLRRSLQSRDHARLPRHPPDRAVARGRLLEHAVRGRPQRLPSLLRWFYPASVRRLTHLGAPSLGSGVTVWQGS